MNYGTQKNPRVSRFFSAFFFRGLKKHCPFLVSTLETQFFKVLTAIMVNVGKERTKIFTPPPNISAKVRVKKNPDINAYKLLENQNKTCIDHFSF